jgi:hypothetical protein
MADKNEAAGAADATRCVKGEAFGFAEEYCTGHKEVL